MEKRLHRAIGAFLITLPAVTSAADITMHRDPGCGCCEKWAAQVQQQFGHGVQIVDDASRMTFRRRLGVPAQSASCHTAVIDGMAFEGHVPIKDMKRVLAQRPTGTRGLAVAGMPIGTPGMEMPGVANQSFDVVAFGPAGRHIYSHYN